MSYWTGDLSSLLAVGWRPPLVPCTDLSPTEEPGEKNQGERMCEQDGSHSLLKPNDRSDIVSPLPYSTG